LLVLAADVVQAPNDKQQLRPMLDQVSAGSVKNLGQPACRSQVDQPG